MFVYDYVTTHLVAVYGSINHAISAMSVGQYVIYAAAEKQVLHTLSNGKQLAISFMALTSEQVKGYILNLRKWNTQLL